MDESAVEPLRLVDDGGGSSSTDPPYTPGPSDGGSSSPSDGPSGTKGDGEDGGEGSSSSDSAAGLPVAAQAGISLGVLGLAVLALLPGRRPPAHLR